MLAVGRTAERPVVVPAFGRLLERARGGMSKQMVVAKIHGLSSVTSGFTRPQLDRYESGQTPRPDPVYLFFLAKLYRADLADWLSELVKERESVVDEAQQSQLKRAVGESPPGRQRTIRGIRPGSR